MVPEFDRDKVASRILRGLAVEGPAPITRIYGFCGARHGGDQHFVRQGLSELKMKGKIRLEDKELYQLSQPVVASQPELEPETLIEPPEFSSTLFVSDTKVSDTEVSDTPPSDTICLDSEPLEENPKRKQAKRGALRAWVLERLVGMPDHECSGRALIEEAAKAGVSASEASAEQGIHALVKKGELERPRRGFIRLAQKPNTSA